MILYFIAIPVIYLAVSLILTLITIPRSNPDAQNTEMVYLSTNGVHLDIVFKIKDIDSELLKNLVHAETDNYLSFGWGDREFFINTPTWGDLTFINAFNAMFLKSSSLMHVSRYKKIRSDWVEVGLSKSELKQLNEHVLKSFMEDEKGDKIILTGVGHSTNDNFYEANGSYSFLNTCNTWTNTIFKESGLKACFWTPFDFGLLNKYKE